MAAAFLSQGEDQVRQLPRARDAMDRDYVHPLDADIARWQGKDT